MDVGELRKQISEHQKALENALKEYSEDNYQIISKIIELIKTSTSQIENCPIKDAIFVVGPTGVGKSTLITYLSKKTH